jgi:nitroreductase
MREVHGVWGSMVSNVLAQLFNQARTFSYWQDQPVPEGLVQAAFELASLGPTSANCEPLRLVLVRSPQAKERLLSCVSSGNYEKVRTAPITAIVAYDREFFELLPRLYPHSDARKWFTTDSRIRRRDRSAQFLIAGCLFDTGIARARARLRADVGLRRRQGRCCILPRRKMAYKLSVEYRLWRSRPVAPQVAAPRL